MKSYKILAFLFCFIGFNLAANAQLNNGLIAYYPFDDCTATDASELKTGGNGTVVGNPDCGCGVLGDAMILDGIDDHIYFSGNVNPVFRGNDFTISFYFKPFNTSSAQNIMSKRVDCTGNGSIFNIQFLPSLNFITTDVNESATKKIALSNSLDLTCWHHYLLVRENKRVRLYLNGELVDEKVTSTRLDLESSALLRIADSPCVGTSTGRFRGKIDELRIYNRVLLEEEIAELYYGPDKIANRDEIIYKGESVDLSIPVTCASQFSWTPTNGLNLANVPNPTATPEETTTYTVSVLDENGCSTKDTVKITVIDPEDLDCQGIFLPKAFTPNGNGPFENETFGISNPQALRGGLIAFSIFDRLGTRIFTTSNAFDTWDGMYKGIELNSGVFVYQISYNCNGELFNKTGTVTLMR